MTTGAPNTAVTELMASSVGANAVRAMRSHIMQNTAPHRNVPGIITRGRAVFIRDLVICGTAIPTNDIGPDSAVTHADSTLDISISSMRIARTFTPMLCA